MLGPQEALRLFETLVKAQGERALAHVPRMVGILTRCFKDPDSSVADACVDAMGTLAAFAVSCRPGLNLGGGSGGASGRAVQVDLFSPN